MACLVSPSSTRRVSVSGMRIVYIRRRELPPDTPRRRPIRKTPPSIRAPHWRTRSCGPTKASSFLSLSGEFKDSRSKAAAT